MGFGGLYNAIFGDGHELDRGRDLLTLVGGFRNVHDVGRFRDCWLEEHGEEPVVAVYTRNGGSNREHGGTEEAPGPGCDCTGCIATHRLPRHPMYISDADDTYDSTYATFWFRLPQEFHDPLRKIAVPPVDMNRRWKEALRAMADMSSEVSAQLTNC